MAAGRTIARFDLFIVSLLPVMTGWVLCLGVKAKAKACQKGAKAAFFSVTLCRPIDSTYQYLFFKIAFALQARHDLLSDFLPERRQA